MQLFPQFDKKTKIIATISDQRCEVDFIRSLYENGMNVVRLNTAHLNFDGALKIINNVREVSQKIGILIDTKGPEIRAAEVDEPFEVTTGQMIKVKGGKGHKTTKDCIWVNYEKFVSDLDVGSQILIDDGELELLAKEKKDDYLLCQVLNNSEVKSRKSVNVPGVRINLPSVTDKDREFIAFAVENDVDFIAHSFVRNKQDVLDVQEILDEHESKIGIIAKIENYEGVDNIQEIIDHVYGVMIARGDLGIEIPAEKIPGLQRRLIRTCVESKKPVIVATQMLHSMISNPRPTRAEVTDVANAIYYRTDAIMLSGETAYGKYPAESVKIMSKIAKEVEENKDPRNDIPVINVNHEISAFLSDKAVNASRQLGTKAVITDTLTGRTARYLAAFRGENPIFAMCYNRGVMRQLALSYGVFPEYMKPRDSRAAFVRDSLENLKKEELVKDEDLIVYIGGSFGIGGGTTYMEVTNVANLCYKKKKS